MKISLTTSFWGLFMVESKSCPSALKMVMSNIPLSWVWLLNTTSHISNPERNVWITVQPTELCGLHSWVFLVRRTLALLGTAGSGLHFGEAAPKASRAVPDNSSAVNTPVPGLSKSPDTFTCLASVPSMKARAVPSGWQREERRGSRSLHEEDVVTVLSGVKSVIFEVCKREFCSLLSS